MDKIDVISKLKKDQLISVVRIDSLQSDKVIEAIIQGGIHFIEITFTMKHALHLISSLNEKFEQDEDIVIGAGTILDEVSARLAILNGAKFIVSPSFDPKVAELCNLYRIAYIPGIHNPNDIQLALKSGCDVLKIFPASTLEPFIIKEFKGPYPQAQFIISGKVNETNAKEWLSAGAYAVCLGSVLTNKEAQGLEAVSAIAQQFAALIHD